MRTSIVLAGCSGSTEPASDVGPDSATLNARGTADNGNAYSYFEYQLNGRVGGPRTTPLRPWPAGSSGPISEKVRVLEANSTYSFRVCGGDDGASPVCAQTRTFTTKPAVQDEVYGTYRAGCCLLFSVDAASGPSGESPHGSIHEEYQDESRAPHTFTGPVSCLFLSTDGNTAFFGAVGVDKNLASGQSRDRAMAVAIQDGRTRPDVWTTIDERPPLPDGSNPRWCNGPFDHGGVLPDTAEFVVNDAAP